MKTESSLSRASDGDGGPREAGASSPAALPTVYEYMAGLLDRAIARFGLHASRALILRMYEAICREALAFPLGTRPPGSSRINHDGTPIQLAATLGPRAQALGGAVLPLGSVALPLQFLGDAGAPGLTGRARMQAGRDCIEAVAAMLGLEDAVSAAAPLLDALAPPGDIDLLADPAGAYWIGAACAAGHEPGLRVYVNARWGAEAGRWARLHGLARSFGCASWPEIAARAAPHLQPLGAALTFRPGHPPSGRLYLSAYGRRMAEYEDLAETYGGPALAREVRLLGQCLLGEDYAYPTQSAVCSFGLEAGAPPAMKLELCAHCLYTNDAQAAAGLSAWCDQAGLDPRGYQAWLEILSPGPLSDRRLDLHCYAGVGLRGGAAVGTIYLKPRVPAP